MTTCHLYLVSFFFIWVSTYLLIKINYTWKLFLITFCACVCTHTHIFLLPTQVRFFFFLFIQFTFTFSSSPFLTVSLSSGKTVSSLSTPPFTGVLTALFTNDKSLPLFVHIPLSAYLTIQIFLPVVKGNQYTSYWVLSYTYQSLL